MEENIVTCAECDAFVDPKACETFNNFIARVFGFIFRSDRAACVRQIREKGVEEHARIMAERKRQSLPR